MNQKILSVIIPAYNCSDTIARLLESISIQYDDDIEVIICDDQSTDNFMDKVKPYYDKLNIKYYKTKNRDIHCPGNTRFDALDKATGEWIIFIDSDDMFCLNAFRSIKKAIKECDDDCNLIISNFKQYDPKIKKFIPVYNSMVWLHGKIYNRKWLFENDINFKENLYMLEDMHFNNMVIANIIGCDGKIKYIDDFTYVRIDNDKSFTNSIDTNKYKIVEIHFNDYITAFIEPTLKYLNKYPNSYDLFFKYIMNAYLHIYLYMQLFMNLNKDEYIKENLIYVKNILNKICNTFNVKIDDIINYIYSNPDLYNSTKNEVEFCEHCKFVEISSLYDFTYNLFK